jgi:hypothetical protein
MDKITTTIKREWLRKIAAGRKTVEYREIKPYWTDRLLKVKVPFHLRLINGMQRKVPEVTVRIDRVRKNSRIGEYELHIGKIVEVHNWDRKREQPSREAISNTESAKQKAVKLSQPLSEFCVYTIVNGTILDCDAKQGGAVNYLEKRFWITAVKLLEKARDEGMRMPVIFGDANECCRLRYWGLLIEIDVQDCGTHYTVDSLRKLGKHRTQELVLRSTRKHIAPNFIKPYAICMTPKFLNPVMTG